MVDAQDGDLGVQQLLHVRHLPVVEGYGERVASVLEEKKVEVGVDVVADKLDDGPPEAKGLVGLAPFVDFADADGAGRRHGPMPQKANLHPFGIDPGTPVARDVGGA